MGVTNFRVILESSPGTGGTNSMAWLSTHGRRRRRHDGHLVSGWQVGPSADGAHRDVKLDGLIRARLGGRVGDVGADA